MKPYIFNGVEYNDLNSLALAYKENFDLGVTDIYANAKKLVKFLKERTNNKDRVKNLVDILALSKYKNNALTFVIFDFLDIKEVIINGENITFEELIGIIQRNPNVENNVIFSFIEDHGITRCFERMDPTNKNYKDMYFVERYFDHEFTYKYLTTIFDYEVKESFEKKVQSIIIEKEEYFRRSTKLMKSDDFMLWIAHKYGFKEAIKIANEKNPVFYSLKLLKSEIDEDELRVILADSFFWWLYDNFEKYEYSKKAILIQKKLIDIKKEYSEYLVRIEKKDINKVSFDNYADISRSLYLSYLDFVYYFKDGSITVNRKLDQKKYIFDKPYCYTYITEDYMKGKVIKLYQAKENENGEATNTVALENLNDDYNEKPMEVGPGNDDEIFFREKKSIVSNSRFATYVSFIGFLTIALFAIGIALGNIEFDPRYNDIKEGFSVVNIVLGFIFGALALGMGIFIIVLENRRNDALNDYQFFLNANTKDYITLSQEERYFLVKSNLDGVRNRILNRKMWFTALLGLTFGLAIAMIAVVLSALGLCFIKQNQFTTSYSKVYVKLLVIAVPALLSGLVGLLKRKNPVLITFLTLMNLGIVFVVLMFM